MNFHQIQIQGGGGGGGGGHTLYMYDYRGADVSQVMTQEAPIHVIAIIIIGPFWRPLTMLLCGCAHE